MRAPGWHRDRRLWILIGATLVGLSLAWAVKAPCVGNNWDGRQYERLCYNDIQPLYSARHMDDRVVPYVDDRTEPGADPEDLTRRYGFLEYPVLTGVLMFVAAQFSKTADEFMVWNAILLSLFALGTTLVLYQTAQDKRRVALWALGPPLFLYAFHNWDLIAVFFAALAIHFHRKGNAVGAGVALALGASAKLFPAFLAPAFGLAILRQEHGLGRRAWGFGLAFVGTAVAVNLPFFLANRELFLETYRFHLRRDPNFETLWYVIGHYGRKWNVEFLLDGHQAEQFLSLLVPLALLAGLTLVGALVLLGRLDAVQGGLASLLLFMVFNKIFSVQYALWLLPFFVVLNLGHVKYAVYALADLLVYVSIFTFFLHTSDGQDARYFDYVAVSVVARTATLLWILVAQIWKGFARARPAGPQAEPGAPSFGASVPVSVGRRGAEGQP